MNLKWILIDFDNFFCFTNFFNNVIETEKNKKVMETCISKFYHLFSLKLFNTQGIRLSYRYWTFIRCFRVLIQYFFPVSMSRKGPNEDQGMLDFVEDYKPVKAFWLCKDHLVWNKQIQGLHIYFACEIIICTALWVFYFNTLWLPQLNINDINKWSPKPGLSELTSSAKLGFLR